MLNIKVLKALNGDSIIISYGDDRLHYILVDGGRGKLCFHQLCKFIDEIKEKKGKIDLLVLTHIDSDHIDGILRLDFTKRLICMKEIQKLVGDRGKT